MEVYLVRHTETICEKGICYGQSDVELLTPYEDKFESIKNQIPIEAKVYTSPLIRCVKLANYIATTPVIADARLMEMNFGDWEMQNWDAIPLDDLTPWMEDFVNIRISNGEAFVDLHHRVLDFLENELQNNTSKPVVIVAHAGVIRSILCAIRSIPLQDAFQNKVDFGSVLKIEF